MTLGVLVKVEEERTHCGIYCGISRALHRVWDGQGRQKCLLAVARHWV